jgi:type III restriction enzyme
MNAFFERSILNSPYECPRQQLELDESGQPAQRVIDSRRKAEFVTPIPKPRKQKGSRQQSLALDDGTANFDGQATV